MDRSGIAETTDFGSLQGQVVVLILAATSCHRDSVAHESAFSPMLEERNDSSVIIDSCFMWNEEQQSLLAALIVLSHAWKCHEVTLLPCWCF